MQVRAPSGRSVAFTLGRRDKRMIVDGLGMVGMTLEQLPAIEQFEARHYAATPWMQVLVAA